MTHDATAGDPSPTIPVLRFGEEVTRAPDPFDAWRSGMLPKLGTLYETVPLEPFGLSGKALRLGDVGLNYVRTSSQRWARTAEHARRDDADQIVANLRFAGGGLGEADGREMRVATGEIMLFDLARAQTHDSERSHTVGLFLPRSLAATMVADVGVLHGLVVPPAQAALLLGFLRDLEGRVETLPAAGAGRLGSAVADLLAVAISQVAPGNALSPTAIETAGRAAAERVIEARLGSATLTVANLCRWVGVSRSRLYRLFEPDGGVQAYIRARRLDRVSAALVAGRGRERVSDLADQWGFCDAAYLTRLFREAYGMTPGEYRERHRAAPAAGLNGLRSPP